MIDYSCIDALPSPQVFKRLGNKSGLRLGEVLERDLIAICDKKVFKLFEDFIKNPEYSFKEFWNRKKRIGILLDDFGSNRNEKREFLYKLFLRYIDYKFQENIRIFPEFNTLLHEDRNYNIYFSILERDIISILNYLGFDFNRLSGKCIFYPEIEEPDIRIPKIIIKFPTTDFDLVLDTLEEFVKDHESLLKLRFGKEEYLNLLLEEFKRTTFIFKRLHK